ncbi:MAG: ATP-binding cassette domain-containing protein [Paludibacterium sp.]|uniref:ATP-binding cassette domain-containing protein n=1 Tax=Paludibacterium sp. TaxID=1917523 RepID=UPI0025EBAAD2|nr:ATP-binding cassette domain-containing protein [Paludibacterium sp.]MBV8045933.1 ATP-binding cassette domain-containing protein [Paludibacterium sp.]MBV8647879.1 ATP-binding cassette domain-containing protein [Paludibacterium sp.]
MDILLQLQHCRLARPGQEIGPFSLAIGPGERVAILGPSGAGKSSLLRLMAGEFDLPADSVRLDGRCLSRWTPAALSRRRGVLPQSHQVAFGLRADLVIALGRLGDDASSADAVVTAAARQAACEHLLARRIDTLSGGEAARVHLARVFAQLWDTAPGLILVDEPLSALDPGLQHRLSRQLDGFARERGHAVVAVLHDINHAMRYFDRLLLLKEGRLAGDLPAAALQAEMLRKLYGLPFAQAHASDGRVAWLPAA